MSDFTQHGKSAVLLLLFVIHSVTLSAQSEIHRDDAWIPDNNVNRVEHSNGYTMLSGPFTSIGQYSGHAVYTDVATGKIIDTSMPIVNGTVQEIISDGNAGWYIAGYFDAVDTVKVRNLAHIKSDKTVDRSWKPNPDGAPAILKLNGATLLVGGYFNEMAGQVRNYLASFNTTTGALNAWNPDPNSYVEDIEISGVNILLAGSFTSIGGTPRSRLAAVNAATGVLTTWAPNVNGEVTNIAVDGTGVFAAGYFTSAGSAARAGLARIDLTSGLATAISLNLNSGGAIYDMEIAGSILYAGGYFTAINGVARTNLASVNIATGTVTPLNAGLTASDYIMDIAIDGSNLYVAGFFTFIGGNARANAAAMNASTGALLNWDPSPPSTVYAVLPSTEGIWIGGDFTSMNTSAYNGFVLIEESTNKPWPFQIDVNGPVNTMAIKDEVLYIGGQFNLVNKNPRVNLAAFNLRTGALLPWDPRAYGLSTTDPAAWVNSMKIKGNLLYIGGKFHSVNAIATVRPGLAAVDLTTGAATSWNPVVGDGKTTTQYVNCIDIVENTLYAGGFFNLLNLSVTRNNIAAINTENANILAWDPNSTGEILRVSATPSSVYVTGYFDKGIGEANRPNQVAALSVSTGKATSFNPDLNGFAYDVVADGSNVFVAGYYSSVAGEFRPGLSSFSASDGSLNNWTPDLGDDRDGGYGVFTLAKSTSRLYVGGSFRQVGNEEREYYAEYDLCPSKPAVTLNGSTLSTTTVGDLQWYANGEAVPGATTSSFEVNPLEYGAYAVSVTAYGCEIFSDEALYVVTALESTFDQRFKAYPNPVDDWLTVELPGPANDVDITITDLMGRILSIEKNTSTRTLSFAGYGPGIYVVTVRQDGVRYTKKIMKVK